MGAVYQAWDAELGVAVAIKTIRPGRERDAELPRSRANIASSANCCSRDR